MLAEGFVWLREQLIEHEDFTEVEAQITPAFGTAFTANVIPSAVRGEELFGQTGDNTKLLTTAIYILRSVFTAQDINEPPMMATVDVHGLDGWAINMTETQWGEVLVKLGLMRETLAREWQARRNASV